MMPTAKGKAKQGKVKARRGETRQGEGRQGKTNKTRQGKARQDKARHGKARQGNAVTQGKARQPKRGQPKRGNEGGEKNRRRRSAGSVFFFSRFQFFLRCNFSFKINFLPFSIFCKSLSVTMSYIRLFTVRRFPTLT
jgi:hypothetical protein